MGTSRPMTAADWILLVVLGTTACAMVVYDYRMKR